MKLIKLDAIDSTNDFLKALANEQKLENFTVVTAENQTNGKGQMGAHWLSEESKNLIMSIFVENCFLKKDRFFDLNIVVSVSVLQVLQNLKTLNLSIKWPNDIMSYNYKIGGILIENTIKSDECINSIIGIGLNVNQTNFENLPKASSLALVSETIFDKEKILIDIVRKIESNWGILQNNPELLRDIYRKNLFKISVPMAFKNKREQFFMGIIQGVASSGKLQILLENDAIAEFEIKEIEMQY